MKIQFESELMKNQKQAVVMTPGGKFQVVQSVQGQSLFFSIGTDHVFYLTEEVGANLTGWNKQDLSSPLNQFYAGSPIVAKSFDVSQSATDGQIHIALVVTVKGTDYLYLSLNNSNTDTSWAKGVQWTVIPFDDPARSLSSLEIANVYIRQAKGGENIAADVVSSPGSSLNFFCRYFIDPTKKVTGAYWNSHPLPADLNANNLTSCLGRRTGDPVDGIYTLGEIAGTPELFFTPLYNAFSKVVPPPPPASARFNLPPGATAIATAPNPDGTTQLFAAGNKGLYLFPSNQQHDGANGVLVASADILAGVQSLHAVTDSTTALVWGLNQQGDLFYLKCALGNEGDNTAWSVPLPILTNVEGISTFINSNQGNAVLFAQTGSQSLAQLIQDPVTTNWQQRNIVLPSTNVDDVLEVNSFTTHIQATDDSNLALPNTPLSLTSTSPVTVYVNNIYHVLSDTVPISITTDGTGVLTIVQETQGLDAVCYHIAADGGVKADINPMSKMVAILSSIKSGSDLAKVQVTNADGTQQNLLPAGTNDDQKDAAAQAVQQLSAVAGTLPPDGSLKSTSDASEMVASAKTAAPPVTWAVAIQAGKWTYHMGDAAVTHFGPRLQTAGAPANFSTVGLSSSDLGNAIEATAGDLFNWLKDAYDDVTQFFVQTIDDVAHFFVELGGTLYHIALDCVAKVVKAVEFVFNKIKVFLEDLIKWLGFLFSWPDIVRAHKAIKNLLKCYAENCVSSLDTYKQDLQAAFTDLENKINNWAGIPEVSSTPGGLTGAAAEKPGQNSPQAHWGLHQLKSNVDNATATGDATLVGSTVEQILDDLLELVGKEEDTFTTAVNNIKTQIVDQLETLTVTDILKKIIAIVLDVLLETVENVVVTAIDILEVLVEGVIQLLGAPISIPVISSIYKDASGDDLSILDLVCLVTAIPVTVVYKLASEKAPFPADDTTAALIAAPDFAAIQQLYAGGSQPAMTEMSRTAMVSKVASQSGTTEEASSSDPVADEWNNITALLGFFGALEISILTLGKSQNPDSALLAFLGGIAYLPYIAPDITPSIRNIPDQPWYVDMNEIVTAISVVKAMVDIGLYKYDSENPENNSKLLSGWYKASPYVECGINAVWLVPDIAAVIDDHGTTGIINCVGNTSFDLGGILAPGLTVQDEKVKAAFLLAIEACTIVYGFCCLMAAPSLASTN